MEFDTYSIVYHIVSNFLPYFGVTVFMLLFLGWMFFNTLRNYLFIRKIRRSLALYVDERREQADYGYAKRVQSP